MREYVVSEDELMELMDFIEKCRANGNMTYLAYSELIDMVNALASDKS